MGCASADTRDQPPSLTFLFSGDIVRFIDKRQNIGETGDSLSPHQEVWRGSCFLLSGQLSWLCPWPQAKSSSQHLSLNQIRAFKDEARNVQKHSTGFLWKISGLISLDNEKFQLCSWTIHPPKEFMVFGSLVHGSWLSLWFLPAISQVIPWNSLRI